MIPVPTLLRRTKTRFVVGVLMLASGCAARPNCSGEAPAALQRVDGGVEGHATNLLATRSASDLMCWAAQGDRVAQFALGHAYEFGLGVTADVKAAKHYYRKAAANSPKWLVYSPPLPGERYGRVLPVTVSSVRGLVEAKMALERLERSE